MSYQRRMDELPEPRAWNLLRTVRFGRLFFVHNALPAVRPVNHLVDGDAIIIRATRAAASPRRRRRR